MGNYASTTELKARFEDDSAVAYLTDTSDSGVPDEDVLEEVITAAESELNSYLARKYLIPIDTSSDSGLRYNLRSWTLDLAVAKLHGRNNYIPPDKKDAADNVISMVI